MGLVFAFLGGFLVGGVFIRWLIIRAEQAHVMAHEFERHYVPASEAIMRHVRSRGTINAAQAQEVLAVTSMTAQRFLDQMHQERLLKRHGHAGQVGFYTLP